MEYEGEFRYNRKWNGKGYDTSGNIIYELINGNGKVKEYWHNDLLKFEGEYLNGLRNGKGKEYNDWNGDLKFEGEYLNGKKHGKGKEYNWKGKPVSTRTTPVGPAVPPVTRIASLRIVFSLFLGMLLTSLLLNIIHQSDRV